MEKSQDENKKKPSDESKSSKENKNEESDCENDDELENDKDPEEIEEEFFRAKKFPRDLFEKLGLTKLKNCLSKIFMK